MREPLAETMSGFQALLGDVGELLRALLMGVKPWVLALACLCLPFLQERE